MGTTMPDGSASDVSLEACFFLRVGGETGAATKEYPILVVVVFFGGGGEVGKWGGAKAQKYQQQRKTLCVAAVFFPRGRNIPRSFRVGVGTAWVHEAGQKNEFSLWT